VQAQSVSVSSSIQLVTIVGTGATSGKLAVRTAANPNADSKDGFVIVGQPTIEAVAHTQAGGVVTIVIAGTNFVSPAISINGGGFVMEPRIIVSNGDTIIYKMPGSAILTDIVVKTPGREAEFSAGKPVSGGADLNLPDFGNGLTVVPTSSLDYSQIYLGWNTAFSERLWGNTLLRDSNRQKLGLSF